MVPTTANGKLISAVFLKVRLHTAINRDDFVSWCMLYNNNNNNLLLLLTKVFFSGVLQKLCTIQCDTIQYNTMRYDTIRDTIRLVSFNAVFYS